MDVPVTPDNTQVLRIMSDFNEFMQSSNRQATSAMGERSMAIKYQRSGIPFCMPEEFEKQEQTPSSAILRRAQMAQIQGEHASDKKAHRMAMLDLETRNEKLTTENMRLRDKCDDIQLKVKQVTMQAIHAQEQLQEIRNSRETKKDRLEDMVNELQKEKQISESKLQQELDQIRHINHELRQQNTNLGLQMNIQQEKLEETTTLLQHRTERVAKLQEDVRDHGNCEKQMHDYRMLIHDLESRLSRCGDAEHVVRVMKDDLERLRQLEIEVVSLRESNHTYRENESNIELMKEQLLAAEDRLIRSEKRIEKAVLLELENKELISQLDEAKSKELSPTASIDFQEKLWESQRKEALLVSERGELNSEVISMRKKCELLRESVLKLEQKVHEKTESMSGKETQIKHLQKRALLLTGERNSLRAILQSYDSELTTTSHADQLITRAKNAEVANEKVHTRLEEAQREVQEVTQSLIQHKLHTKQLENTISELKKTEVSGDNEDKDRIIEGLRIKVEELEKDRSNIQREKEHLELWVEHNKMRGDFDPVKTKVLHFQLNPADLAHRQIEAEVAELRTKCKKLQEKIRKMEADQDVTMSDVTVNQGGHELKLKLDASELRNQRLKEVFSKKIQEFRQACYNLTGFRIDYTKDEKFKLASMYAEKEADYLLFKLDSSGVMHLLETEYSKTLESLITLHLHHQNSIPMFLSSITANLFSDQTMMTF